VAQDVIAVRYAVSGDGLLSSGTSPAIDLVTDGASADLVSDAQGRIWLGVSSGMDETTYFVIDRKPSDM
jgi:hypothetical protein